IHRIHQEDPQARFVLIGFSFGANMVCSLANSMNKDGIPLDLLVYLGGNTLHNNEHDQPPNTKRILNILATGAIWHGDTRERRDIAEGPARGGGSGPATGGRVAARPHDRAVGAAAVPGGSPNPAAPEPAPPPRPARRGEWDFLKPVSRISYPK